MKTHAEVVIIGGGSVGCSALYHLTQLGVRDAVLLERDELTAGSTWHAAGNCPNFSTSWNLIKLQRHSTKLYSQLGARVGYDMNYHVTGSIRLAHTADRVDEFRHVVSQARAQGIEFEMLSPAEIRERHPFITTDDIKAGLYDPYDGDIDPAQLTQALAKGARDGGATIYRQTRVTAIERMPSGEWRRWWAPISPSSRSRTSTSSPKTSPNSWPAAPSACRCCATPMSAITCARSGRA
jgi:dimethylglycine dehydrogenase